MKLSDISVHRPVFATVVSLLLIVLGVISFTRLPLRELPDIDPPVVSISTTYTGASAAVSGLPEWNLMSGRILKVTCLPSSETLQLSATRPSSLLTSSAG